MGEKYERVKESTRPAKTVGVTGFIRDGTLVKGYRRATKHSTTRRHLKRLVSA